MDESHEPTNRELLIYIKDIRLDVSDIKLKTGKTNGRVSALENWRWFIAGGLSIIVVLLLPIIFLLIANHNLK